MERAPRKRILILGGGFAGLTVAMELEKKLAQDPSVEITLINRENFFLFTPMLHEVAASDLDLTTIVNPVRKMLRRVHFFAGEVNRIDIEQRRVFVSHGFDHHHHTLEFDFLVLGLGSVTNHYGLPGLQEYALTMKSLGDAMQLRNHLIAHLEEADSDCCKVKEPLLAFVVAGGGFAGVETVAGINDFVRGALRSYPNLTEDMLRIVLVHSGPVILPELDEKLGAYAQRKLVGRKVEVRLNTRVEGFSGRAVRLSDGSTIHTNTLLWTAGTSPNPLLETIPCAKERGRLLVTETLELQAWPGVWALGDCAAIPDRTGRFYPPTAQHALREAKVVAHNIIASVRGKAKKRFDFLTIAQLAAIGRRTGVANVLGINFSGFVAWWLWRTIYLSKLPRLEKKLRVAFDWTLDLIFSKDLVQFLDIRAPMVSRPEGSVSEQSKTVAARIA
jgi:NADH:ubiquinone reductase (H+-translocating)